MKWIVLIVLTGCAVARIDTIYDKKMEILGRKYAAEKAEINNSTESQEIKDKKLNALNEKYEILVMENENQREERIQENRTQMGAAFMRMENKKTRCTSRRVSRTQVETECD